MRIVLLGAPGSGKGTQAELIFQKYGIPHISTGDIFRDNIKRGTPLGLKVKAIIDAGDFCPDDLTVEIVKARLSEKDCENGYLLDGFPRTLFQASELDKFCPPDKVVNLDVDYDVIRHRITGRRLCSKCGSSYHVDYIKDATTCAKCGGNLYIREDDNPVSVKERLSVYEKQTFPLIDYYKKQGKLVSVNGNNDKKEDTFASIVKVLGK